MTWLVLHQSAQGTLATDRARVPAAEVAALTDAIAVLGHAQSVALATAAQARAARAGGYDDGFAQGLAAARGAADAEFARTRAAEAQAAEAAIAALRADATRLALEIVRHIAGALAPDDLLVGLARTALDRLGPGHVTLRVAPAQAARIAHELTGRADIRVLADPTLGRLDLVLETPQGSALAGLDPQLARIAEAWEVADAA